MNTQPPTTHDLGPIDQIPMGEGRLLRIGHIPVAVFREREGGVFATQALCPHLGGPLTDGIVGGGQIHCPIHSYKFELDSGKPIGNECEALKTYPVTITDQGHIQITVERRQDSRSDDNQ